jgi:DNA modification methylase
LQKKREMTYQILHGNNLDILPTLADNSIDSIVTDPPYELGFMGKKWDSSGIAYSVELWQQCLRVLKPGGHLLSFGGTRTYHRVAVAIEDAGFELRDSIAWLYGSGFPKSLDVSKAIDKELAKTENEDSIGRQRLASQMRQALVLSGKSRTQIDDYFGTKNVSQYWFSPERKSEVVPADKWPWVRDFLNAQHLDSEVWRLNGLKGEPQFQLAFERKATGYYQHSAAHQVWMANYSDHTPLPPKEKKDRPLTPEAQQWQGWGTALKPAFEPVIVARKPIEGTVANNVLKWGTGGLNIDGSRIGTQDNLAKKYPNGPGGEHFRGGSAPAQQWVQPLQGRWPANLILDEDTAELLDEQSGESKAGFGKSKIKTTGQSEWTHRGGIYTPGREIEFERYADSGGASRFFYVAKASKRDRNEGLEGLPEKIKPYGNREIDDVPEDGDRPGSVNDKFTTQPAKNFHPTVKPTSLMEYLIKLVTPPNGTVLDPFTGSGSTGKAAILQGFDFIGIEMTEEYLAIIEGRLKHAEHIVAERIKETSDKQSEVLF